MSVAHLSRVGVLLLVTSVALPASSILFPLTENPISQGGAWINGGTTGLDWSNVQTIPGLAFGTETGIAGYDDSTAVLSGFWNPDQTAQATVYINPDRTIVSDGNFLAEEVELRLRTSISAFSITGYEIDYDALSRMGYLQIVRWNGPLSDFTVIADGGCGINGLSNGIGLSSGDVLKASVIGDTITAYINNVQICQVTDSMYTDGSPGIGFFLEGNGVNSDFGFTDFTASVPEPSTGILLLSAAAVAMSPIWKRLRLVMK